MTQPGAPTILNVDDTEAVRYAKSRVLKRAGFTVIEAATGADTLALVRDQTPDLVLLDVMLPDINGIEVCRRIKQSFPAMLVLQVSASFITSSDRVRGLSGGADSYLTEPVEPEELVASVQALLRLRQAEEAARRAERRALALLEGMAEGFMTVDADFRVTSINREGERIQGRERAALLGQSCWALWPAAVGSGIEAGLRAAMRDHAPVALEYHDPARGDLWLEIRAAPTNEGLGIFFRDIGERKRAEQQQLLLLGELSHRVKNTLAVLQSVANQTAARAATPAEFVASFQGRLQALAVAHDLLTASGWRGAGLPALARTTLLPHVGRDSDRIALDLDDVSLKPAMAQLLVLALHELATNAAKHGALSGAAGRVRLTARLGGTAAAGELHLEWREEGGPPVRQPPATHGFGMMLLTRGIIHQHGGSAEVDWRPDGLAWRLVIPLTDVVDVPGLEAAGLVTAMTAAVAAGQEHPAAAPPPPPPPAPTSEALV